MMSTKEKRSVTFEEPEFRRGLNKSNLGLSEPDLGFQEFNKNNGFRASLSNIYTHDRRSRPRDRCSTWSRFRARRTKSYEFGPGQDSSFGSTGPQNGDEDFLVGRMVRTSSRASVRSLVRMFEFRSMNEGRKSQVVLLDDRRLDIIIQFKDLRRSRIFRRADHMAAALTEFIFKSTQYRLPKLYASELLDLVSSHFKLKEKRFFGLGFLDETNHFNWLQGDKRVLDHEFPKKSGLLILYFAIKLYVDTIGLLKDTQTVELYYLNAQRLLYQGQVQCKAELVFELAAHVLQATSGDYTSDRTTKDKLKKLPVIPTYTLKEHPSLSYCEEKIIAYYKKMKVNSRGQSIVNYMTIVEGLETYGIHYYDVKDKKDIPWWLGVSPKGIAVYDLADKTVPRKLFQWKSLENLYYRDKKFSIEVSCPRRVTGPYRSHSSKNVDVHTWLVGTQQLAKCIWSMAVIQHQFYLDHRQFVGCMPPVRSMSEIAADLSRSTTSLPGSLGSDLSDSNSSHSLFSLSNSRYDLTIEQTDSLKAEREMYQALKAKREALEEALGKKIEELKALCVQEGELTGQLPHDIPLLPGEQPPAFRRRVGTAFSLSVKNLQESDQMTNELSKLELEVELQDKITAAASRLATDKTVTKYVRKQRKQSYVKAVSKLKDMRKKLEDLRQTMGKYSPVDQPTSRPLDGMYHVLDPCSKADLDIDSIALVHGHTANRRRDSCGNSINSVDFSMGSDLLGSKGAASSGYFSCSASSVSNIDDMSSLCGSIGHSTIKSFRRCSTDVLCSDAADTSSRSLLDEDQNLTLTRQGRRKHYIITRGEESCRVQELDNGLNVLKSSTSLQSVEQTNPHLASTENDLDLDSTLDDSFLGNNMSFDDLDDAFRENENKICTRVERRKLKFIASKHFMKNLHIDVKHRGLEQAWETFQHILMGDDFKPKSGNCSKEHNSSNHSEAVNLKPRRTGEPLNDKQAELQRKIQELINSGEPETPLVRSRSFDYSRDLRVNEARKVNNNTSKDDLKLAKTQPKSKDSSSYLKNPFSFLTQRHKTKQTRHSLGEAQSSALFGCASAANAQRVDVITNRLPSQHPTVKRDKTDHSKIYTNSNKGSNRTEKPHPNSDSKIGSVPSSKTVQYPRSSSAVAASSKRNTGSESKVVSYISTPKCSHIQQSGCGSTTEVQDHIKKSGCDHVCRQHPRRRLSWHSHGKALSLGTKGTETTV